jgi:hypothetical protein
MQPIHEVLGCEVFRDIQEAEGYSGDLNGAQDIG